MIKIPLKPISPSKPQSAYKKINITNFLGNQKPDECLKINKTTTTTEYRETIPSIFTSNTKYNKIGTIYNSQSRLKTPSPDTYNCDILRLQNSSKTKTGPRIGKRIYVDPIKEFHTMLASGKNWF
ncbi:Hypothetical_protein [Hexamita inflata]|uniref:Hypothetical_protein n=1 Tax=Hexamita inflata TaxID=28002 RepID=A0AA86NLK4_9EUKA|nr:Hypothetical protein HINF_LOCUS9805 [Hexamita inflata]